MAKRPARGFFFAPLLAVLCLFSGGCESGDSFDPSVRPSEEALLFDYAAVLTGLQESCNRYLTGIRRDFGIEAVILTLPSLEGHGSLEAVAAETMSSWRIGGNFGGRGLLLLFVDDQKLVKLEVAYELEDIFTDVYTGFVEDRQLGPNYRDGELGVGLLAVMEEMELRAEVRHRGGSIAGVIEGRDGELVSGGGGARRGLPSEKGSSGRGGNLDEAGAGGATPAEAWEIMLSKWKGERAYHEQDIYTESTKLAMGDQNNPDRRTVSHVETWAAQDYEVLRKGDYAVISFGNTDGWDRAPWLFARTEKGWKFDIVNQRKWVVMGRAPKWHVERADHPYVDLFPRFSYTMSKDIPLLSADRYDVHQDGRIVEEIQSLQKKFEESPGDFEAAIELGRLGTITSMRPNKVLPALERAKALNPQSPLPYKYMAIRNVEANFQYETALAEMSTYVELLPEDPFGHRFIGFLYLQTGQLDEAVESFARALSLNPDDCYAHCKTARAYAKRYLKSSAGNLFRERLKDRALDHLELAGSVATPDPRRIGWLARWMKRKGLTEE